ncbi:hypothetical protein I2501_09075 [Streptacidiphilus sp. NEAU-YB345]|uniref:Uncharacterized protein n=1 Tax=Streptacidiphilus fuscans TaxID=2789292 RepID=A0A931AZ98_9ACTN|nr:hypothetical protein [Streptacidiphilus fuscans]
MPGFVRRGVASRQGRHRGSRGLAVKKLLLVVLAALGGYFVYRQVQADRAEQDLWTEATDPIPAGSR